MHTFHHPRSHYPFLIPLLTCRIDMGVYASIYSLKLCVSFSCGLLLFCFIPLHLSGCLEDCFLFLSKLPAEHTPGVSHSLL